LFYCVMAGTVVFVYGGYGTPQLYFGLSLKSLVRYIKLKPY
jgi:hypothetical protein